MDKLLNFNNKNSQFVSYTNIFNDTINITRTYSNHNYDHYSKNIGYEPVYQNNTSSLKNGTDNYFICKLSELENVDTNKTDFKEKYESFSTLTKNLCNEKDYITDELKSGNTIYIQEYIGVSLKLSISCTKNIIDLLTVELYKFNINSTIDNEDTTELNIDTECEDFINFKKEMYNFIINLLLNENLNIKNIFDFTNHNKLKENIIFMYIYLFHLYYKQIVNDNISKKCINIPDFSYIVINNKKYWDNTNFINFNYVNIFDNDEKYFENFEFTIKQFMDKYFLNNKIFDEYWYLYSKLTQINKYNSYAKNFNSLNPVENIVYDLFESISLDNLNPDDFKTYNQFKLSFNNPEYKHNTMFKPDITIYSFQNIIGYTKKINLNDNITNICKFIISPYMVKKNVIITNKTYKESILNSISKYSYGYIDKNTTFKDRIIYSKSNNANKKNNENIYYKQNNLNLFEYKFKDILYLWYISNLYSIYYNNKQQFILKFKFTAYYKGIDVLIYIDNEYYNKYLKLNSINFTEKINDKVFVNYYSKFLNLNFISNNKTLYNINKYNDVLDNGYYQPWNTSNNIQEYKYNNASITDSLQNTFNKMSLDLFDYQKENVNWMNTIETKMRNNNHYVKNNLLYLFINANNNKDLNKYNRLAELYNYVNVNFYEIENYKFEEKKLYLLNIYNDYSFEINNKFIIDIDNNEYSVIENEHQIFLENNKELYNSFLDYPFKKYLMEYAIEKIIKTYYNKPNYSNFPLKGGFLCDDVGLGKTLSTVTHCLHQLQYDKINALPLTGHNLTITEPIYYEFENGIAKQNTKKWMLNNLIVVPTRLIKQWAFEIEKYSSNFTDDEKPTILTLLSITDIKKYVKKNNDLISKDKDIIRPDFVIMSVNVFNNANYFKYLASMNESIIKDRTKKINNFNAFTNYSYSITDYFDIYQIQWNRIIIDEVHETIGTTLSSKYFKDSNSKTNTSAERKKTYSLLTLMNSNYKWGLSATPFQFGSSNKYGYYNWMNDSFKCLYHKIYVKESYLKNIVNDKSFKNSKVRYNSNKAYDANFYDNDNVSGKYYLTLPFIDYYSIETKPKNTIDKPIKLLSGITNDLFNDSNFKFLNLTSLFLDEYRSYNFTKMTFSKTCKSLVKKDIGIPIFTEEVKWIKLSTIEKNMYNNAKSEVYGRHYNNQYANTQGLKRLFQICTNILISDEDIMNMDLGDLSDRVLSLEDLNKNMILHFQKKLKTSKKDYERLIEIMKDYSKLSEMLKCFLFIMKNKWSPSISVYTTKFNQEYYFVTTYFDKFNSIISRMKHNNAMDSSRYVNYNDNYKFESYQMLNLFITDLVESSIDNVKDIELIKYLDEDKKLFDISENIINTICIPKLEEIENIIKSNIGNFTEKNLNIDYVSRALLYKFIEKKHTSINNTLKNSVEKLSKLEHDIKVNTNQIKLFESNDFIKEKTDEPCIICWSDYEPETNVVITKCRHVICGDCFEILSANKSSIPCPECRQDIIVNQVSVTKYADIINDNNDKPAETPQSTEESNTEAEDNSWVDECLNKYGTKMTELIRVLKDLFKVERENENNRVIVFSQYDNMLKLISKTLTEFKIKNVHIKGNVHSINKNIDKFKRDNSIRVIMLSSENSNSGCNLTEANHIIFIDVINANKDTSKDIECQAIGRSVRLGQKRPVKLIRFITEDTIEDEYYNLNKYDINTIQ